MWWLNSICDNRFAIEKGIFRHLPPKTCHDLSHSVLNFHYEDSLNLETVQLGKEGDIKPWIENYALFVKIQIKWTVAEWAEYLQ